MPIGLLGVSGTIDLTQFWPTGESDAETLKVHLSGTNAFRFTVHPGAAPKVMATVIKPLGEALAALPAGLEPGRTAGPPFGLTRHVVLPVDARSACVLVSERFAELTGKAGALSSSPQAPASLARVETALRRVSNFPGIALQSPSQVGVEVRHEATA